MNFLHRWLMSSIPGRFWWGEDAGHQKLEWVRGIGHSSPLRGDGQMAQDALAQLMEVDMWHVTQPPQRIVTQNDVIAVHCEKASLVDNVKDELKDQSHLWPVNHTSVAFIQEGGQPGRQVTVLRHQNFNVFQTHPLGFWAQTGQY